MGERGVIFDIGGVLEITPETGWQQRWEQRLGVRPGDLDRGLREVWEAGAVGSISEAGVRARVSELFGLDRVQLETFMADLWAEYLGSANRPLITYIRDLRKRCRVGILSNSFVGAREREEKAYGFADLVDDLVYSHEVGFCKPDLRAYQLACSRLGVELQHCLFVDDRAVNVGAARAAGMAAVLFEGNTEVIARIEAHVSEQG